MTQPISPIASEKCRPATAFLMASFLTSYPDAQVAQCVNAALLDPRLDGSSVTADASVWRAARRQAEQAVSSDVVWTSLGSAYIDLFDHGRQHNSLYETEYGRNRAMVKGTELADIAAFYRAFGLEFGDDESAHEMLDHVSVELEFYALLLLKQDALVARGDEEGQAIVLDARKKFLESHLGRFVDAIAARPGVAESEFYGPVLAWCRDLVAEECQRLQVAVQPVEWRDADVEQEQMNCGSTCSPLAGACSPALPK